MARFYGGRLDNRASHAQIATLPAGASSSMKNTASAPMIRPCVPHDLDAMEAIINAAARKYRGAIPADCWHEPYMPHEELECEIAAGVRFWGYGVPTLLGVMGLQNVHDATLIRHAYVLRSHQGQGIGGALMRALMPHANGPLLVGTWAAATWAIAFYERQGFRLVTPREKDELLDRYWNITPRQKETSVVLVLEARE
jgi:GNAT superfamily N-acetyltransferase